MRLIKLDERPNIIQLTTDKNVRRSRTLSCLFIHSFGVRSHMKEIFLTDILGITSFVALEMWIDCVIFSCYNLQLLRNTWHMGLTVTLLIYETIWNVILSASVIISFLFSLPVVYEIISILWLNLINHHSVGLRIRFTLKYAMVITLQCLSRKGIFVAPWSIVLTLYHLVSQRCEFQPRFKSCEEAVVCLLAVWCSYFFGLLDLGKTVIFWTQTKKGNK